jgi:hypothetical protein
MSDCNCAAGPWCYDVESAPSKVPLQGCWKSDLDGFTFKTCSKRNGYWSTDGGKTLCHPPYAWATINTPDCAAAHQAALKTQQLNDMEHTP